MYITDECTSNKNGQYFTGMPYSGIFHYITATIIVPRGNLAQL